MCGILGFISSDKYEKVFNKVDFKKLLSLLDRRGPDHSDYIVLNKKSTKIFLGHTRLSIQDVSSEFNQPYSSKPYKNHLIYNGEIYNYKIFNQYKDFSSDTKALYNLLSTNKYPLSDLDGIFSFAFWNDNQEILYLARDRFGVKPLFIFYIDGFFAFSSSLRVLEKLCGTIIKLNLNKDNFNELIDFGYSHDRSTIFKRINKLEKNTILKFNLKNWKIEKEKIYEELFKIRNSEKKVSLKLLKENLVSSIKTQIDTSNRGFGFFLSGGTDSSLLVSEAIKLNLNSNLTAYSLIVPGKDSDESENLILFEKIMGKIKNNIFIKKKFDDFQINNALNLFPQLDYPILDLSILPSIVLCNSVDENIRVILSGDGADEIFAGYQRIYDTFWRFLLISIIPKFIKKGLINYLPHKSKLKKYLFVKHPIEMRGLLMGINRRYPNLYGNYKFNIRSIFKSILQYEIDYYLPSVLEKIDAASMLSSLEVRVPFLSKNIINYMNTISLSNLIWQRSPKYHLKKLLAQNTSKKYAFTTKKGFGFNDKNQFNTIIKILEDKNYPVLIENENKLKVLKNKSFYIRLLLLKHWLFGYKDLSLKNLN